MGLTRADLLDLERTHVRALHTMRSCIKIYSARTCERSFSPSSRSTKCNHALRSRALAPASAHFHLRTMSARTCERSFTPALLRRWKKSRQRVNARKGPKRVTFTPRPPFGLATTSRPPVDENSHRNRSLMTIVVHRARRYRLKPRMPVTQRRQSRRLYP